MKTVKAIYTIIVKLVVLFFFSFGKPPEEERELYD